MAGATPRLRVEALCQRIGTHMVVEKCLRLLAGEPEDPDFIVALGAAHASHLLDAGVPAEQAYWLRVHGARGLLWAGPGERAGVLRDALKDDSWRVREMTCKVIARHRLGDLFTDVAALADDPVVRVSSAASRAVRRIVEAEV